ncbi:MAG TPA: adenylyl-sulfate kinase [Phycisphaerales bacterium]|nr:adenylyl-sulfate kinase [Phycisphaerales bacterium]HMP38031.1 adenylyl-sulfate kinase [Phycisphaerales bacterium]
MSAGESAALGRSSPPEIHWHGSTLTRAERFERLGRGATMWFTGLSGSGKSTIAAALEATLIRSGVRAYRLDGDNVRTGLNSDLGFGASARTENVRRLAEVARLMADSGAIAIVSAISPFRADRAFARRVHQSDREGALSFIEVFVDAPLAICEARDPKGLYRKARAGELPGFTGIDSPYEAPEAADIVLDARRSSVEESVRTCLGALAERGLG